MWDGKRHACWPRSCRVASTPEALDYAVRNLGFVCVNGEQRLGARPHPAGNRLADRLQRLLYCLLESQARSHPRVVARGQLAGQAVRLAAGCHAAHARPAAHHRQWSGARLQEPSARHRAHCRPPIRWPRCSSSGWRSRGPIQPERLERLIREGLQGRYVIVQTGADQGRRVPARGRPRLPLLRRPMAVAGRKACASRISPTTSTASGWRRPIA